ncbi:MAG: hypothetical protein Q9228_002651, partial [Teloschistes exilis]
MHWFGPSGRIYGFYEALMRCLAERLNYILWIQDLLDTTSEGYNDRYDEKREVVGLD